ncbi:MAG: ankyrin repeat domain-containing protein, partial [Verrucomicrobiota bacterium]|nr:ankyrin repeat domain-containing protein [Verrucomicrobiota bacterium]
VRGCFNAEFDRDLPMTHGWTPLFLATMTQDWRQAHELLRAPGSIDAIDETGRTALMIAAKHGSAETVRDLLANFANPNAVDAAGRTALHYAVGAAQPATVEILLRATATSELRWPDGRDLRDLALATQNWAVAREVLDHFPASYSWSKPALSMLRSAAAANDIDCGRFLMNKHLQQPTLEGHAVPLLAHGVVTGDGPLVKALLKFGANPNTVVPAPCEKDFLASIKSNYLRDYVAADSGTTVLMLAAGLGDLEMVQTLLAAGADRNRTTAHYKMMPLYFATRTPAWRVTQTLLGSGGSPDVLRIDISLATQRIAVLKGGAPVLTTACSTGREGFSTPAGSYVITDKDRDHRSTIYKVPMPYFMRLNCRDFGLHEGNVASSHASHGCIRLPGEVARKLFSEIPVGTVVNIN